MSPMIPPPPPRVSLVVHNASWGCQYSAAKLKDGHGFFCRFPRDLSCTLNLGWITPHLFSIAARFTAISPTLWASMISDPPVWLCLVITVSNVTLEHSPVSLTLAFLFGIVHALESMTASDRTLVCTITATHKDAAKSLFTYSESSFPLYCG